MREVYICLEECEFFMGEDGCANDNVDDSAVYEREGSYPLCPSFKALEVDVGMLGHDKA